MQLVENFHHIMDTSCGIPLLYSLKPKTNEVRHSIEQKIKIKIKIILYEIVKNFGCSLLFLKEIKQKQKFLRKNQP